MELGILPKEEASAITALEQDSLTIIPGEECFPFKRAAIAHNNVIVCLKMIPGFFRIVHIESNTWLSH